MPLARRAQSAVLAAVLAALAPHPGFGATPLGGESPAQNEALLAAAHDLARQHPSVVTITFPDARGKGPWCTGVLVALSPDERFGYALTAAHSFFCGDSDQVPAEREMVTVDFEPDGSLPTRGYCPVTRASRVIIHPDRTPDLQFPYERSKPAKADLALVEFPLQGVLKILKARGIQPAELHEGPVDYQGLRTVARIVGAGPYATSSGPEYNVEPFKLHAGNTWVSYGTFQGHTGFYSWHLLDQEPLPDERAPGLPQRIPLLQTYRPAWYGDPAEGGQILVQPTCQSQIVTNVGDSGGPAFLNSSGRWKLGGINSRTTIAPLMSAEGVAGFVPCYWSFWEPVDQGVVRWIQAVRTGNTGKSRILVLRPGLANRGQQPMELKQRAVSE